MSRSRNPGRVSRYRRSNPTSSSSESAKTARRSAKARAFRIASATKRSGGSFAAHIGIKVRGPPSIQLAGGDTRARLAAAFVRVGFSGDFGGNYFLTGLAARPEHASFISPAARSPTTRR
jgi:hypothetical protein